METSKSPLPWKFKRCFVSLLLSFVTLGHISLLAQADSPTPPAAGKLLEERDIRVSAASADYEKKKADLFDKYAAAIEREILKVAGSADAKTVLEMSAEAESAKILRTVSPSDSPALTPFRNTLTTVLRDLESSRQSAVNNANTQLLNQLTELRTALLKAGDTTAVQVDLLIKSLAISAPVNSPKSDSPPPSPKGKNPFDEPQPMMGTTILPPATYSLTQKVIIGNRINLEPEDTVINASLTINKGTIIENQALLVLAGEMKAKDALFRYIRLESDLRGTMQFSGTLFDQCIFAKGGNIVFEYFSTKWVFDHCVFNGTFLERWRIRHIGIKMTNCTFHDITFVPIEYVADASDEVRREWLKIENCRFINCKVPESFLIATKGCSFENCEFLPAETPVNSSEKITARIQVQPMQKVTAVTPNFTIDAKDGAQQSRKPGANVKYQLLDGNLSF